MNIIKTFFVTAVVTTGLVTLASAQDPEFKLPEQCEASSTKAAMDHSAMGHDSLSDGMAPGMMESKAMPEHVRENMRRMMITMPAMQEAMMIEDADVAFACGMIAHHQGAIDMAQVLLESGDDPQMIELAGEIIAAQVGEIELMTKWLAENAE